MITNHSLIALVYLVTVTAATFLPEVRWCALPWLSSSIAVLISFPVHSHQWSLFGLNFWPGQTVQRPVSQDKHDLGDKQISRVLNFFPVPVDVECLSQDRRRRGICMNTYECRIQRGKSHGACALGFGVCCIFTASCGQEVQNNLTYVTSPGFPNLIDWPMNCSVAIRKIDRQVSQLRIDFVHFNIGQPNIRTGVCDADIMEIRSGRNTFQMCGWNSGQHLYMDVNEADELVTLDFRLPGALTSRMWEMRVEQLGFEQRAPSGCLQYFSSPNGTLKTFNYLENGRFLAGQDYLVCVRQERNMCGISYTPCTRESFRIGGSRMRNLTDDGGNDASTTMSYAGNMTAQNSNENSSFADMEIEGSGAGPAEQGAGLSSGGAPNNPLRRCRDRVLIPCDFEEFITPGNEGAGICNLEHCGDSLCEPSELDDVGNCRVETWATPFRVRVAFGPGQDTGTTLEDNIGMCLMYEQLTCTQ